MSSGSQCQLVERLLNEQDAVLDQLEALNLRVEKALQEMISRQKADAAPEFSCDVVSAGQSGLQAA